MAAICGGSVVEVLILMPFRFAINSRRHNIALRMLGLIPIASMIRRKWLRF